MSKTRSELQEYGTNKMEGRDTTCGSLYTSINPTPTLCEILTAYANRF